MQGMRPQLAERGIEAIAKFLQRVAHDPIPSTSVRRIASLKAPSAASPAARDDIVAFEADPAEVRAVRKALLTAAREESVIVEKRKPRYLGALGPRGFAAIRGSSALLGGVGFTGPGTALTVTVAASTGAALADAHVSAYWQNRDGTLGTQDGWTDAHGQVDLNVPTVVELTLYAEPAADHWPVVAQLPPGAGGQRFVCAPIRGSAAEGWWRRYVREANLPPRAGLGMKVGVIDSGIGPHPALAHAHLLAVVGEGADPAHPTAVDLRGHGTHVAGVIGARPTDGRPAGLAAEADLFGIRIFGAGGGADQGSVAVAVQTMADAGLHIANLSLGAPSSSRIERQEIEDAYARGLLCVAAAGNQSGPVEYPGAYPEVVAVAAIGELGSWEPGSPSAGRHPATAPDWGNDGIFGANFSNRGRQVQCHAPGVAIVSTVADATRGTGGEAVMDGTSMSAPICTGLLTAILSQDPTYLGLPPDRGRCDYAKRKLKRIIRKTGLRTDVWGAGTVCVVP